MLDKREPGVRDMLLYHPERENPVQYSAKTEKCTQNSYVRFDDRLIDSVVIILKIDINKNTPE